MILTDKQTQAIKYLLFWYGWVKEDLGDRPDLKHYFNDKWVHPNRMKSLRQLFKDVELPKKKHKEIIK